MAQIPRLYIQAPLEPGGVVSCTVQQAHYLRQVLRLNDGAPVEIFNGEAGSWRATLQALGKKDCQLALPGAPLRPQQPVPDLWLVCAPLRQNRLDMLVEKATELGVARICPVLTQRSAVRQVNDGRLRQIAIEAAEQCGRDAVPEIAPLLPLPEMVGAWPAARPLLLADETGQGAPAPDALKQMALPLAVAIGPEGGWTPEELHLMDRHAPIRRIGLGPRILRAETAGIAALAVILAACGEWRTAPRFAPAMDDGANRLES